MSEFDFRLPDLGEGMEEAEIVAWFVAEGDEVTVDQTFVEVQTDKASVEIPSPVAGWVTKLHGSVGDVIARGLVLATFRTIGLDQPEPPTTNDYPDNAVTLPEHDNSARPSSARLPRAAPAVRRLAQELSVDLTVVDGTGPNGRIMEHDVRVVASENLAATPHHGDVPPWPESDRRIPLRGVSRRVAELMEQSWSSVPHTWTLDEMDASELLLARDVLRASIPEAGPNITLMAFFVMAVAHSLRDHPLQNASVDMGAREIIVHGHANIRFAVASDSGLQVPVIKNADQRSIRSIAAEVERLTAAARSASLAPIDTQGGTFTISNFGTLGARFALPIVRLPDAGIIGFGDIKMRPWVVDGQVQARPVLPVTACVDHRILGGADKDLGLPTGGFLVSVIRRLSHPLTLLLGD